MANHNNTPHSPEKHALTAMLNGSVDENDTEVLWKRLDEFNRSHSGRLTSDDFLTLSTLQQSMETSNTNDSSTERTLIDGEDVVGSEIEDHSGVLYNGDGEELAIPELPTGKTLRLTFVQTWGDPFYVGLNGIDIFTESGDRAEVDNVMVTQPAGADSCALPNYVRPNAILQCRRTRDDTALWLAPYQRGNPPSIFITFKEETTLAMLRVWNYNKSRVHSSRGVRQLRMHLDGHSIFDGEIRMAHPSNHGMQDYCGDTILFTTSSDILELIAEHDNVVHEDDDELMNNAATVRPAMPAVSRPGTADPNRRSTKTPPRKRISSEDGNITTIITASSIRLEITKNWGMPGCVGLCGVHFIQENNETIAVDGDQCTTSHGDLDSVTRLFSRSNLTTASEKMFLCNWDGNTPVNIEVHFEEEHSFIGLAVYNYNENLEMSYAGVQTMTIYMDDECIARDVQLRKAPGHVYYDYVQDVSFPPDELVPSGSMTNGAPEEKGAFVYQLQLLDTWGDEFYIGLNGVEMFDEDDCPINVRIDQLAAYPESINVLTDVTDDPRTSANLIDGVNDSESARHVWLAPVMHNDMNRVFVIFDKPMQIGRVRLWNYSKTPERGVRNLCMLVDDTIVFSGELPMAENGQHGKLDIRV